MLCVQVYRDIMYNTDINSSIVELNFIVLYVS